MITFFKHIRVFILSENIKIDSNLYKTVFPICWTNKILTFENVDFNNFYNYIF